MPPERDVEGGDVLAALYQPLSFTRWRDQENDHPGAQGITLAQALVANGLPPTRTPGVFHLPAEQPRSSGSAQPPEGSRRFGGLSMDPRIWHISDCAGFSDARQGRNVRGQCDPQRNSKFLAILFLIYSIYGIHLNHTTHIFDNVSVDVTHLVNARSGDAAHRRSREPGDGAL
jgi:hypothetical protein